MFQSWVLNFFFSSRPNTHLAVRSVIPIASAARAKLMLRFGTVARSLAKSWSLVDSFQIVAIVGSEAGSSASEVVKAVGISSGGVGDDAERDVSKETQKLEVEQVGCWW